MGTVTVGGRMLEIRPFNLKALRRLLPKVEGLGALDNGGLLTDAQVDDIVEILHSSLDKNDGVTRDWIEENVDVTMLPGLFDAVLKASGFKRAAPGEAGSP